MKFSKAHNYITFHNILMIKFEGQQLNFFAGLLVFQPLIKLLNLKRRLKKCFGLLKIHILFERHVAPAPPMVHALLDFCVNAYEGA